MNQEDKNRREHIATVVLAGMMMENPTMGLPPAVLANQAVQFADALITELDKDKDDG